MKSFAIQFSLQAATYPRAWQSATWHLVLRYVQVSMTARASHSKMDHVRQSVPGTLTIELLE